MNFIMSDTPSEQYPSNQSKDTLRQFLHSHADNTPLLNQRLITHIYVTFEECERYLVNMRATHDTITEGISKLEQAYWTCGQSDCPFDLDGVLHMHAMRNRPSSKGTLEMPWQGGFIDQGYREPSARWRKASILYGGRGVGGDFSQNAMKLMYRTKMLCCMFRAAEEMKKEFQDLNGLLRNMGNPKWGDADGWVVVTMEEMKSFLKATNVLERQIRTQVEVLKFLANLRVPSVEQNIFRHLFGKEAAREIAKIDGPGVADVREIRKLTSPTKPLIC